MKTIAIIGAGASGIFCAINLKEMNRELKVTLYEQSTKLARKVLASGNGHCNISNKNISTTNYYSQNPDFVNSALETFTFKDLEEFMLKHSMLLTSKDDGRCYPFSNEAKSVVKLFEAHLQKLGIELVYDEKVEAISKIDKYFQIAGKKYDAVIVATGSEAASQLGGNASGYTIAQNFGHSIVDTYPSLVQLHVEDNKHTTLSGVKLTSKVSLYIDGKKDSQSEGDLLFAKYGLSGLAILDISHNASLALSYNQDVEVEVNLLPQFNPQQLVTTLQKLAKSDLSIEIILNSLIHSKVALFILKELAITPNTLAKSLNVKELKKLVAALQFHRFKICDTHGFKHAEVSGGGVSSYEINSKTFESDLVKDLYFIGEVLDVVGDRGGYNFHFCFASAFCCAKAVADVH